MQPTSHPSRPDFLALDELFSERQRECRTAVRRLVSDRFEKEIATWYEQGSFPAFLPALMGEHRLLGANLSGFGLPGIDQITYGIIMQELERCDSGIRSFASVQGALVMYPIAHYGSDQQQESWLAKLGAGTAVGAFGLTEADGGSDPGRMITTARDCGDHWILNGQKSWVTNGSIADVVIVWAKTPTGVQGFVLPTGLAGLRFKSTENKLSMRASITSELVLSEVKVPKDAVLPKAKGLGTALDCLNQARFGIVWGVVGAAEACYEETRHYVSGRRSFGGTLASKQLVQMKLATMLAKITQAQLLALRLAQLKEAGKLHYSQVSLGKLANVEMALEVARTCREILGGNGILGSFNTMRHLCNLETVLTYEGTHDIHALIVGQQITGESAF